MATAAMALRGAQVVYEKNLSADLIALDAAGNAYAASSGMVTKLAPDGSVVYSKPVGLSGTLFAIAVDAAGEVALVGSTTSDQLPTTPGVFQPQRNTAGKCVSGDMSAMPVPCPDAFAAKLDAAGNVAWASYLGGSLQEQANAVAFDISGNLYVAGLTQSSDFPNASAFQSTFGGYADAFIVKVSADGTKLLYASFLGGAGYDFAQAVAIDAAGNAYVAGEGGVGLPKLAPSFGNCLDDATNAFLIKVAPAGDHLIYAGCLSGSGTASEATAIALDAAGNAYLGGYSNFPGFPLTAGAFDGRSQSPDTDFVAKISADGSSLVYSALLDGASFGIYSIGVDATGTVYAAGSSSSAALPVTPQALQICAGPESLIYNFVLQLNPAGSSGDYLSYEDSTQPRVAVAAAPDGTLYEAVGTVRKISNLAAAGGPSVSKFCVLNGASFASHLQFGQPGISPGEIVTLKGTSLGPASGTSFTVSGNAVPTLLAQTQVFFDNLAAPVLYAQNNQINVVAPYQLAGQTQTVIQVQYQGQPAPSVTLPVSPTSPAVFENLQTGAPLVLNADFSLNSAANPALRGSVVVMFLTGAGATSPPSVDGQIWQTTGGLQASVAAQLLSSSSGASAINTELEYAGPAPGLVAGVEQLNIDIPAGIAAGSYFLNVTIGDQMLSVPAELQ
ncbi:MAG TPA: SBBP repeat-containing protein [Bryobacteraceae bacterium]|nr:SBBP repeat-containing protein [Bryobacteraceae bacterium]